MSSNQNFRPPLPDPIPIPDNASGSSRKPPQGSSDPRTNKATSFASNSKVPTRGHTLGKTPIKPEDYGIFAEHDMIPPAERKCHMCLDFFGPIFRFGEMEDHRALQLTDCDCLVGYSCLEIWMNDAAQDEADAVGCPKCRTPIYLPRK